MGDVRVLGGVGAVGLGGTGGYLAGIGPRLAAAFLERGLLLRPLGSVVYLMSPYVITPQELATVDDVIAHRIEAPAAQGDLPGVLLVAAPDAGVESVRDEAITFLLLGHDTVAHALTCTWVLLADHPGVEARLHEELARVLAGRMPGAGDLPALLYARSVFAEALRLRPPAWVIVREASESCAPGGRDIVAGTLAIVSPPVLHRDPRVYPDPLVSLRRDGSPEASRPKLSYLPFGAGPRSCIGEQFAWMEGTLVLATVAHRWRLRLVDCDGVRPLPRIRCARRPR